MRLIQNLKLSWETIFYDKNTLRARLLQKKMIWPITTHLDPSIGL
jgi:hypothetical protein